MLSRWKVYALICDAANRDTIECKTCEEGGSLLTCHIFPTAVCIKLFQTCAPFGLLFEKHLILSILSDFEVLERVRGLISPFYV